MIANPSCSLHRNRLLEKPEKKKNKKKTVSIDNYGALVNSLLSRPSIA